MVITRPHCLNAKGIASELAPRVALSSTKTDERSPPAGTHVSKKPKRALPGAHLVR